MFVILATGLRDLIVDPAGRIPVRVDMVEARCMNPPPADACAGPGFGGCRCGADGFTSTEAMACGPRDRRLLLQSTAPPSQIKDCDINTVPDVESD